MTRASSKKPPILKSISFIQRLRSEDEFPFFVLNRWKATKTMTNSFTFLIELSSTKTATSKRSGVLLDAGGKRETDHQKHHHHRYDGGGGFGDEERERERLEERRMFGWCLFGRLEYGIRLTCFLPSKKYKLN
ncbi:hypothetical protein LOK49_LG07G01080 [Camellia lanceoleosa]|uniref:Uncharacterized protein n=1 Tax=Camellia lanceoleosa TaxID=1840588 RepID=A0ACC0H660_9ERIC|nr:hypothetical protein LOK49_LG07G01080 [Camellia lanceoleosa]